MKNSTYKIRVDGEDREVFMSFGMLGELTKLVVDPADVPQILLNPEVRDDAVRILLAKRKKSGKITQPVEDVEDIDVDPEEMEALLNWTMEHVMSFFVRSLQKTVEMGSKHYKNLSDLRSSLDSLKDSPSATA